MSIDSLRAKKLNQTAWDRLVETTASKAIRCWEWPDATAKDIVHTRKGASRWLPLTLVAGAVLAAIMFWPTER